MIYKYERACLEAGMKEEDIKEIRRMFDAEYKTLKRRREQRQKYGFVCYSLDVCVEQGGVEMTMDIPDEYDLEENLIHKLDLARLGEVLQLLSDEDRCFILDAFNSEIRTVSALADKYGISWYAVKTRKERLLAMLREKFNE